MSLKTDASSYMQQNPAPQLSYAAGPAASKPTSVPHVAEAYLTKILQEEIIYNRYPETNNRASQHGARMVQTPACTQ